MKCGSKPYLCTQNDCIICFERSFASHEKAAFWSDKNKKSPREVLRGTHSKYYFNCPCGHEIHKIIKNVVKSEWCGYCCTSGTKLLCGDPTCAQCFDKSFASNEKSVYWSNKNNKKPIMVPKMSHTKYFFDCECGHEFDIALSNISTQNQWCSYCSPGAQKLCDEAECELCFNKSFASHEKAKFWSVKNEKKPREVIRGSPTRYTFDCRCGHEIRVQLSNINVLNRWCGYCCVGTKKLCADDKCAACFNNSFASHEKAKFWSVKNEKKPREVIKCSATRYYFSYPCGHEHYSTLNALSDGPWCPLCKNKTEKKLHEFLDEAYNVVSQPRYDWCVNPKTDRKLPFDFALEKYRIIVELDGLQHFKQVRDWKAPEEQHANDVFKMNCAMKQGYTIIRLYQQDVFDDKGGWEDLLTESIKEYAVPTIVYISTGDHYDLMKEHYEGLSP